MLPPKKITIMSATGEYNLGDECILAEEIDLLFKRFPELEKIFVLTYHQDSSELLNQKYTNSIEYIPYFPHNIGGNPFRNIGYFIQNLKAIFLSDWIIIGGGGIFFDTLGTGSFRKLLFLWKIRIIISRWLRKFIFVWAVSFEISEIKHKQYLEHLFGGNELLTVRNEESKILLSELGYDSHIIEDPVIGTRIIHKGQSKKCKKVGLALRGDLLENEWENLNKIIEYVRSKGLEPVFITHSFHSSSFKENDFLYYQEFAEKNAITITKTLCESIDFYKEISFMITIRLHGAIISASAGIPFLAITYGEKTKAFPKRIDYPYWIEGKVFSSSPWKEYIDTLIQNEEDLSMQLIEKTQKIRENNIKELHTLWNQYS